jgi:putative ABC transport system ATP-binding protein
MPDDSLIQLIAIDRTFTLGDSQVHALRKVDLTIKRGEYIAVMGPSGSGKSTLLNLIGLLDRADSGTYKLEGRDVTTLNSDEQAKVRSERIGFIFQSFNLVPRLSAAENIELPLTLAGVAAAERTKRVMQALKEYSLTDRAHHRPNELSGGQRQRVAIARATILRPAVLLADEPTGNLDRVTGEEVVRLIEALNAQGMTLIVVTHDLALGARARRQIKMEDGGIVSDVTAVPDSAPSMATETAQVTQATDINQASQAIQTVQVTPNQPEPAKT